MNKHFSVFLMVMKIECFNDTISGGESLTHFYKFVNLEKIDKLVIEKLDKLIHV